MRMTLAVLLVILMTPIVHARDWDKEDKYSNPRARGSDSVYDQPRSSGNMYSNDYRSNSESRSEPSSYGSRGVTYDRNQVNDNGLIINRDR